MTDIYHYNTVSGGEIEITNGQLVLDYGPTVAYYHALFGGNHDDPGMPDDTSKSWWGNAVQPDTNLHYRGRTQYLLDTISATSAGVKRISDAVRNDIAPVDRALGVESNVDINISRLNSVSIVITNNAAALRFDTEWSVTT